MNRRTHNDGELNHQTVDYEDVHRHENGPPGLLVTVDRVAAQEA